MAVNSNSSIQNATVVVKATDMTDEMQREVIEVSKQVWTYYIEGRARESLQIFGDSQPPI